MGFNKVSKLDSKVLTDDIIDVKEILILLFGRGIIFRNYIGTVRSFNHEFREAYLLIGSKRMLVINLITLLLRTLNAYIKALATLTIVLVISVALNITQIAYDFSFIKVFFLFPDSLNTIQLRPDRFIQRHGFQLLT